MRGEDPAPQGGVVRQAGPRASRAGSANRDRVARFSAPSPDDASEAEHPSTRIEHLPTPDERIPIPQAPPLCELDLNLLVQDVLARHPSIEAAAAAWRAAAQRYPQVVSLDDPMLDFITAPASIGTREVDYAYAIQGRQKLPWHGKRQLRGEIAQHEARAMSQDVADAQLTLTLATKQAFYDYFLVRRQLSLNAENRRQLQEFRRTALTRYEANLVSQQDVLLAEVNLADLERQQVELVRKHRVAIARINTLLLRLPNAPLPPPPGRLAGLEELPPVELVTSLALDQRPEIRAASSRLAAERTGVALAEREFKPDLELVGRYDSFWLPQSRLTGQVGLTLNVPLAREKRRAAVREASSKTAQRRAELDRLCAKVQFEVYEAYELVTESSRIVTLYQQRVLPAAEESVRSAEAGYQAGNLDFLRLIEAQGSLIEWRQKQVEAEAEYHSRLADLERASGGPMPDVRGELP